MSEETFVPSDSPRTRWQAVVVGTLPGLLVALACVAAGAAARVLEWSIPSWAVLVAATLALVGVAVALYWAVRHGDAVWRSRKRLLVLLSLSILAAGALAIGAVARGDAVDLEARFAYQDSRGTTRVLPPGVTPGFDFDLKLTRREVRRRSVDVPIGLALANRGYKSLSNATVEISYPAYLSVRSNGRQGVRGDNATITYENKVPIVRGRDPDTFRATPIDTLRIGFRPWHQTTAALTKDGVPVVARTTIATFIPPPESNEPPSVERLLSVPISVRVFDGDDELGGFVARVRTPPLVSDVAIAPSSVTGRASDADRRLVRKVVRYGKVRRRLRGDQMGYTEMHWRGTAYQLVTVGRQVRWVMADVGANGRLDWQLLDVTEDGSVDLRGATPQHPLVERWHQDWIGPDPTGAP